LLSVVLSLYHRLTEFPRVTLLLQFTDVSLVFRVVQNGTLKGWRRMLNKMIHKSLRAKERDKRETLIAKWSELKIDGVCNRTCSTLGDYIIFLLKNNHFEIKAHLLTRKVSMKLYPFVCLYTNKYFRRRWLISIKFELIFCDENAPKYSFNFITIGYRRQFRNIMLSEQGWSWQEN
jgi:hypothetical protein